MDMMPAHYFDATGGTLLSNAAPPIDLGWAMAPGQLPAGATIYLNSKPYQIVGYKVAVNTVMAEDASKLAGVSLNLPILEVFVCEPGKTPAGAAMVAAPADALEQLRRGALNGRGGH